MEYFQLRGTNIEQKFRGLKPNLKEPKTYFTQKKSQDTVLILFEGFDLSSIYMLVSSSFVTYHKLCSGTW